VRVFALTAGPWRDEEMETPVRSGGHGFRFAGGDAAQRFGRIFTQVRE
jgi:hypothetical protein